MHVVRELLIASGLSRHRMDTLQTAQVCCWCRDLPPWLTGPHRVGGVCDYAPAGDFSSTVATDHLHTRHLRRPSPRIANRDRPCQAVHLTEEQRQRRDDVWKKVIGPAINEAMEPIRALKRDVPKALIHFTGQRRW